MKTKSNVSVKAPGAAGAIEQKKPETGIIPVTTENAPTVFSAVEAAQIDKIREFGERLMGVMVQESTLYLDLCLYIRENKVAPKLVSATLGAQGFHRVRISEINRVANAPDKYFHCFAAKALGFKRVLQLVRGDGENASATPAAKAVLGLTDGASALKAEGEIDETETGGAGKPAAKAAQSPKEKAEHGASVIFKARADGCKVKEWNSGDGWILRLVRAKSNPAGGPATSNAQYK